MKKDLAIRPRMKRFIGPPRDNREPWRNPTMTKEELINWAKDHGWKLDRYGHFQRTTCMPEGCPREVRTYRLKLCNIAARYEVKTSTGCYAECGITPVGG